MLVAASVSLRPAPVGAAENYSDMNEAGVHQAAIEALATARILSGTECEPGRFCPGDPIERSVMAVWLVRVIDGTEPSPAGPSRFADVDVAEWWAPHVERLAELGVTKGCSSRPARFCPEDPVTRAQMASFLARAGGLVAVPWPLASVVSARLGSPAPEAVSGPFEVEITFSEAVTGFERDDIRVVNGNVRSLTGSGSDYQAVIVPAEDGTVMVRVPQDAASGGGGRGNLVAAPLTRTAGSGADRGIDTWDRDAVYFAYLNEFRSQRPDGGYTGNVEDCVAGTTSQAFLDSVVQRVNWYRRMGGLDTVVENRAYSAAAQQAALIMGAAGHLSHYPGNDWACYTGEGASAAASSNLSIIWAGYPLGHEHGGPAAINGQMSDYGDGNKSVGHRRWILYPQLSEIGIGHAAAQNRHVLADVLWVFDDNIGAVRPEVREGRGFVAWPPSGYVPAAVVWGRWSFSLAGVSFLSATVAVSDESGPLEVEVITRDSGGGGAPESSIVWIFPGDTNYAGGPIRSRVPAEAGDRCYTVTISGVSIGRVAQPPYEYATCLLAIATST